MTITQHAPAWIGHAPDRSTRQNPTGSMGGHVAAVELLAANGLEPPSEWVALRGRFAELQHCVHVGDAMLTRLTDAVIDGGDNIAEAFTLACAERWPSHVDVVMGHVQPRVTIALREAYAPVASRYYKALATQFDEAATMFTACARIADPTSSPDVIVRADPKTLKAWRDAETHAATFDRLSGPLVAAAHLVRAHDAPGDLSGDASTFALPLCVDVKGWHRRRLWNAWHEINDDESGGALTTQAFSASENTRPGRCGRWGRLAQLGAKIRAASNPVNVGLYEPPRERFVEFLPGGGQRLVDPEDAGS